MPNDGTTCGWAGWWADHCRGNSGNWCAIIDYAYLHILLVWFLFESWDSSIRSCRNLCWSRCLIAKCAEWSQTPGRFAMFNMFDTLHTGWARGDTWGQTFWYAWLVSLFWSDAYIYLNLMRKHLPVQASLAPLVNESHAPETSKDLGTDKDVLTPVAHVFLGSNMFSYNGYRNEQCPQSGLRLLAFQLQKPAWRIPSRPGPKLQPPVMKSCFSFHLWCDSSWMCYWIDYAGCWLWHGSSRGNIEWGSFTTFNEYVDVNSCLFCGLYLIAVRKIRWCMCDPAGGCKRH